MTQESGEVRFVRGTEKDPKLKAKTKTAEQKQTTPNENETANRVLDTLSYLDTYDKGTYQDVTNEKLAKVASRSSSQRVSTAPIPNRQQAKEIDISKFYRYRVQTGNCYDSVLEEKLRNYIPKHVSYVTDKMLEGKKSQEQGDKTDRIKKQMLKMSEID